MTEYRKYSEEQIQLANSINLIQYLQDQGESLTKSGKDMRWQRNTSVTLRDNRWFRHKTGEGGYPIQFLKEFYQYDFKEAMELLLSYANDAGITVDMNVPASELEKKEFALPNAHSDKRKMYAYLLKTRYLDKDVLQSFVDAGVIYEDVEYHNVVFVGEDQEGTARHAHKRSTYTKSERSYRGNVEGSDPRYSFHYYGTSQYLYVFEAPIDMLSYISLHKEHWQEHSFVSLCGLGMQALDEALVCRPQIQSIYLGVDHDIAGIEGAERISDYLAEKGYTRVAIVQPIYKDFNEDLKARQGQEAEPGVENPNYELVQNLVVELKSNAFYERAIEHKDLTKAFADIYYSLNYDEKGNYTKLKRDFIKITDCALQLEQKYLYEHSSNDRQDAYSHLIDDYRSYQDKGTLKKHIESIKSAFQQIKLTMDKKHIPLDMAKAYRKLASESFLVVTHATRELLKQGLVQDIQAKPKACIIGANGNIFNLMGIATNALKQEGLEKEANEMFNRITSSGSYDEALNIMMEYIEPISVDEPKSTFDMIS